MNLAAPSTPAEWLCLGFTLGWMLATAALIWHMSHAARVVRRTQADEYERAQLPDIRRTQ